jgi:hypothetical protein
MPYNTKLPSVNYNNLQHSAIFTSIYSKNIWGGEKKSYYSGPGSHNEFINGYSETAAKFILDNKIEKIVEIGCGDFNVSKILLQNLDMANYNYSYVGYDVVEPLIMLNKTKHATSKIDFKCKNACNEKLAGGDLLIIRQVLQHLNNKSILKIVKKFISFKYILLTEHQPSNIYNCIHPNIDKRTGASTRLQSCSGVYIEQAPFNCKIESLIYSIPEQSYDYEANINTYLIKGELFNGPHST